MMNTEDTYYGSFFPWFETGLEGLVWSLDPDSSSDIVILETGDWVKICTRAGETVFEGEIDRDYGEAAPYGGPRLQALGFRIHWTQRGFKPDDWAKLFIPDDEYVGFVRKASTG